LAIDENIDWEKLVELSEGYSGADVSNICREAAMMPLRKKLAAGGGILCQDIANLKKEVDVPLSMEDFV
jgi:katanin p60 ATPase-containing subunit A1